METEISPQAIPGGLSQTVQDCRWEPAPLQTDDERSNQVCKKCGVLTGALREINGHLYGVVNIQRLDSDITDQMSIQPLDYDGEAENDKEARHQQRWISNVSLLQE